ncbi:acetyl-CoA carboxylase biotin carboxylase subunit [Carboxydocella sp. JDF658]|nr:acetyl-CoA carboxylase biotin carboxylase subunit [Carboxydocella sp. JDF658]
MFKKILIANRGEIAVRIIRACHELDIATVAVYSEADAHSLHVQLADEAYCLGGPRSYLKAEKIIEVAVKAGAQAVHPGYGFLAENADFARRCAENGLVFIGPSPEAIEAMGDKAVARETMIKAGVPVVPGSEAIIESEAEALKLATRMGFPVLLKAAAGGGGRGMRIVRQKSEFAEAWRAARSEAQTWFNNPDVYLEKYLENCRHIEFQILADNHGNVVYLGERDCSVQRRNQKLIEEAPSPALSSRLREIMGGVAVRAAQAVNYSGAGTVEFLLTRDGDFYFMEMNTRIQVEHPVTEMITGIDLIKEQIRIAAGEPLGYEQKDIQIRGHAIECRINAEDPFNNFLPNPGTITFYRPPGGFGVRLDSAAYQGYTITPFYDSMIGKLIVWGHDRQEAIQRMRRCLKEFLIEGVTTTIPFHLQVLDNFYFQKGEVYTNFLTTRMGPLAPKEKAAVRPPVAEAVPRPGPEAVKAVTGSDNQRVAGTGGELTPELLAVIAAAVDAVSDGKPLQIREIRRADRDGGLAGGSPWRVLGLYQQMQSRLLR